MTYLQIEILEKHLQLSQKAYGWVICFYAFECCRSNEYEIFHVKIGEK